MTTSEQRRTATVVERLKALVQAIEDDDQASIDAILRLSQSRRAFAPLALTVGAVAMLLDGARVLLTNWRLTLVQVLPAVWIWLAMFDLKAHVLHGRSLHVVRGPILIPICAAIVAITAGGFFLNAVFAFAIAGSRPPEIRPAFDAARRHLVPVITSGATIGVLLAISLAIAPRWGRPWFSVSLGIVIGVMMLCYVVVPARLIGMKTIASRRDKLTASALSTAIGTAVCAPAYILGRIGILMLGSTVLLIPGIILLLVGFAMEAGATGAVRAVKLSATLTAGVARGDPFADQPAKPRA